MEVVTELSYNLFKPFFFQFTLCLINLWTFSDGVFFHFLLTAACAAMAVQNGRFSKLLKSCHFVSLWLFYDLSSHFRWSFQCFAVDSSYSEPYVVISSLVHTHILEIHCEKISIQIAFGVNSYSASHDNWCTVGGDGGCRVSEVRASTTSPMPDHKGFKLQ